MPERAPSNSAGTLAPAGPAAAGGTSPQAPVLCETCSAEETEALGAQLASGLVAGDVVLLRGELGSGKTTLVRGVARALGVKSAVTSPTFTIGQRYRGSAAVVSHIDLYRLGEAIGEEEGLLAEYLDDESIVLVEWPPSGRGGLPPAHLTVTLTHLGGDRRGVELDTSTAPGASPADPGLGLDEGER